MIHFWSSGLRQLGGIQQYNQQVLAVLRRSQTVTGLRHFDLHDSAIEPEVAGAAFGRWPRRLRPAGFVLAAWLAALRDRPRLVLASHPHFLPAMLPLRRLGIKVVCSAHGVETWSRIEGPRALPFAQADGLLPVSQFTAGHLLRQVGVRADRIEVVPNTYTEGAFSPGGAADGLRQRHGLQPRQPVIFTLGRMASAEGYKGHEVVMQALLLLRERYPGLHYLIGGEGDDQPRLAAVASRLGLASFVRFAGRIRAEELADHYRLASVFAMPSTGEGFGIAFLEAMACGVPCVAGNADGSVDALDGGRLGFLVDPRDPSAVAAALDAALSRGDARPWLRSPTLLQAEVKACFGNEIFARRLRAALSGLAPNSLH